MIFIWDWLSAQVSILVAIRRQYGSDQSRISCCMASTLIHVLLPILQLRFIQRKIIIDEDTCREKEKSQQIKKSWGATMWVINIAETFLSANHKKKKLHNIWNVFKRGFMFLITIILKTKKLIQQVSVLRNIWDRDGYTGSSQNFQDWNHSWLRALGLFCVGTQNHMRCQGEKICVVTCKARTLFTVPCLLFKTMALQCFLVKKYLSLLLFKFMFSIFCSILLAVFWLYYMDTLNSSFFILELIQWYLKQISVIFRDFLQKLQG